MMIICGKVNRVDERRKCIVHVLLLNHEKRLFSNHNCVVVAK